MKSIFLDKEVKPTDRDLKKGIGNHFPLWQQFVAYTKDLYPVATEQWNFSGEKYGWSYRISDKKRVILYLLPRDKFFKVAFVFGAKAVDKIFETKISENIKAEIRAAKVYAEGRGIRIDVKDDSLASDIKQLIAIKIAT
jgi:hypothetical protein